MKLRLLPLLFLVGTVHADYFYDFDDTKGESKECRTLVANHCALDLPYYDVTTELNGDEADFENYEGSFHKTLEHCYETGLLTENGKTNYERLLTAIESGLQADFDAIERAECATRKFTSPQGAYTRIINGAPAASLPVISAPKLVSAQAAADLIENYLFAICRNVAFKDYGTGDNEDEDTINGGSKTKNAAAILNALGDAYKGPRDGDGNVTYEVLFRGLAIGDLTGPYASQFWYQPSSYVGHGGTVSPVVRGETNRDFGFSWRDFVKLQNGKIPKNYDGVDETAAEDMFYVYNGRTGGTAVHSDGPGEIHFYVANFLARNAFPWSPKLPYYQTDTEPNGLINEDPFVNMALCDIYALLGEASNEALIHAWAHKWRGSRRLRPEAMAGHLDRALENENNPLDLHDSLFATYTLDEDANINSSTTIGDWINAYNRSQADLDNPRYCEEKADTYLLPLQYPEGSPVHPSYVAGHATVSAACSTILKAFFKNDILIKDIIGELNKPNCEDPTELVTYCDHANLTVAQELDKLASNIGIFRNFAGVHYRSDGDVSAQLGELVALRLLQAKAHTYHEQGFTGFELTLRDGSLATVTPEAITITPAVV